VVLKVPYEYLGDFRAVGDVLTLGFDDVLHKEGFDVSVSERRECFLSLHIIVTELSVVVV